MSLVYQNIVNKTKAFQQREVGKVRLTEIFSMPPKQFVSLYS